MDNGKKNIIKVVIVERDREIYRDVYTSFFPSNYNNDDIYKALKERTNKILQDDKFIMFDQSLTRCSSIDRIVFQILDNEEGD